MKKQDAAAELECDHRRMTESLSRLVDFAEAQDATLLREEWDALEARVLAHLDAEEMYLLPGFQRDRPVEATSIRDAHALIRKLLGEIGIAIDLHMLRPEKVTEFRELLQSHVDEERRSLYAWASASVDAHSLRALLLRIQATSTGTDPPAVALSRLFEACEDGEKGYRAAAAGVSHDGYRLVFGHYAAERRGFVTALGEACSSLPAAAGGTTLLAPREGSALGALHRSWIDVKAALASGNPKAVLVECRRGEDAAIKAYREALRTDLPPDIRELVQEQYEAIKKARAEIAALVEAAAR